MNNETHSDPNTNNLLQSISSKKKVKAGRFHSRWMSNKVPLKVLARTREFVACFSSHLLAQKQQNAIQWRTAYEQQFNLHYGSHLAREFIQQN
eukprot:m.79002 g.79002  ORF g.79002 m.79002 type:complete len:93 (+) comp16261_c0_seq2:1-279(+)